MKKFLQELIQSQELCAVYTNHQNTDKFSVGYILGVDENSFLMEHIDPYGKNDGFSCELTEYVYNIEKGDSYCQNIAKLFSYHMQERLPKIEFCDDVTCGLIEYARKNKRLCTVELCESDNDDIRGFVKINDNGTITFECINRNGASDGESIVPIESITRIACGSDEENKYEILHSLLNG